MERRGILGLLLVKRDKKNLELRKSGTEERKSRNKKFAEK
jgi:hypothetical protein